ncbi:MAG: hypothetical protein ACFFCZ_08520 [Promethearchaeota archaeon]
MSNGQLMEIGRSVGLLVLSLSFLLPVSTVVGELPWARTYGGSEGGIFSALLQTADGGYALAGYITHVIGFEPGESDAWLVKTDANGILQWNQTYAGSWDETCFAFLQTADGGYALAGYTCGFDSWWVRDAWLVKTDANGIAQWNQTYAGSGVQEFVALLQTADGGYALAGWTQNVANKAWLVKTDANGIAQWNQTYGGPINLYCVALLQTADDGFTLAGNTGAGASWLMKTNANGIAQWNQTYGDKDFEIDDLLISLFFIFLSQIR